MAARSSVSIDLVARISSAEGSLPGQYRQRLQGRLQLSLGREANVIPRATFTCFDHRDWEMRGTRFSIIAHQRLEDLNERDSDPLHTTAGIGCEPLDVLG